MSSKCVYVKLGREIPTTEVQNAGDLGGLELLLCQPLSVTSPHIISPTSVLWESGRSSKNA